MIEYYSASDGLNLMYKCKIAEIIILAISTMFYVMDSLAKLMAILLVVAVLITAIVQAVAIYKISRGINACKPAFELFIAGTIVSVLSMNTIGSFFEILVLIILYIGISKMFKSAGEKIGMILGYVLIAATIFENVVNIVGVEGKAITLFSFVHIALMIIYYWRATKAIENVESYKEVEYYYIQK